MGGIGSAEITREETRKGAMRLEKLTRRRFGANLKEASTYRKGKIKYFNRAAEVYVQELDIEGIKTQDEIILYLNPEFLKETGGKLFSLREGRTFPVRGEKTCF